MRYGSSCVYKRQGLAGPGIGRTGTLSHMALKYGPMIEESSAPAFLRSGYWGILAGRVASWLKQIGRWVAGDADFIVHRLGTFRRIRNPLFLKLWGKASTEQAVLIY